MDEYVSDPNPGRLHREVLLQLRQLVTAMHSHEGPWGTEHGGANDAGIPYMPLVEADEVAYDALDWLYKSNRVFWFDWASWDEGREIFTNWTARTALTLDHLTTRMLITAVARNDRFCEGAWAQLFEDGQAQALFARLLEIEEHLAKT